MKNLYFPSAKFSHQWSCSLRVQWTERLEGEKKQGLCRKSFSLGRVFSPETKTLKCDWLGKSHQEYEGPAALYFLRD